MKMEKLGRHDNWIYYCVYSRTGDLLATASEDRKVKVS